MKKNFWKVLFVLLSGVLIYSACATPEISQDGQSPAATAETRPVVTEAPAMEVPSATEPSTIYIVTIGAPTDPVKVGEDFPFTWSSDAVSCIVNDGTKRDVDNSGSLQLSFAEAGVHTIATTCTWADGKSVAQDVVVTVVAEEAVPEVVECSVADTGKKILSTPLREDGSLYTWSIDQIPGDKGCAILWEGRFNPTEEQHHVVILSSGYGNFSTEFDIRDFQYAEGSFWIYDPDWEMNGVGGSKASIGEMFVWDKRHNMTNNVADPYNWPILFHRVGERTLTYDPDAVVGLATLSCQLLTEVTIVDVSFDQNYEGSYIASVGADGCWTGIHNILWDVYPGAVDDYHILRPESFQVVMFPAGTTQEQAEAWRDERNK